MEYLSNLTRPELLDERSRLSNELLNLRIKKEDAQEKEAVDAVKQELKETLNEIDKRLKAQKEDNAILNQNARDNTLIQPFNGEIMVKSMQDNAKQQQILEGIRAIPKLKTGDCVETFVCGLKQLYSIEVKPQLTAIPTLETEFVNCVKGLLTYAMFTQMEKSGLQLKTWVDLEAYLVKQHGTKISNYQHLHRLWNCQLQENERFAEYAARLEEKVHHASMHIQASFKKNHNDKEMSATDTFLLIGGMLAAQQIKANNEDAYKSLIKTIDKNWTASALLSEAADYADKMQSGEFASSTETVFHAKVAAKIMKDEKEKKKPTVKGSSARKSRDRLEEYKQKCKNEICEAFLKGSCKYGDRCFRIHPENGQAVHFTEIEHPENEELQNEESDELGNLFH